MSPRVALIADLLFASPHGTPLYADLHLPLDVRKRPPVIVWVHGGGWRFGNRHVAPDLSRFFAERGFAMAAVDYRLSRHAIFPAQIHDLKTAIRWLRSVADTYGFDRDRIGLWGASAGGHLAALAAVTADGVFEPEGLPYREHSSRVGAVAVGYAPIDFLQLDEHRAPEPTATDDPESLLLPAGMRSANPDSYESLLLGAPIHSCPDRVRLANPTTYVGRGAPPFLILHGLSDTTIPVHQSHLLYDALVAHDNEATLCLIEGLGHGFLNRTHLDEGPPRHMMVTESQRGLGERCEQRVQPIFPIVETFFRSRLLR